MRPKHLLCLTLSLSGCSPALVATPDAGSPRTASTAGVSLVLLDEPWRGEPYDLPAHLLPLAVEVRNGGASPVDISLGDFVIVDGRGVQVHACLVDQVLGEEPPPMPPQRGPLLATVGPPPPGDTERPVALRGPNAPPPPNDALRLALPQGRLAPGVAMRGYLYFQLEDRTPRPLRLRWRAHQAGSATLIGEVEVQFKLGR